MKMEDLEMAINETRLLVFLETDSQSGKFNQVMLNKEQFKKVSDAIGKVSFIEDELKPGMEAYEIFHSEEEYIIPGHETLQSINE